MDTTTPNIVGPESMFGVVASVCTWLRKVGPVSEIVQQLATTCNNLRQGDCKWTQHVTSNNVAPICTVWALA